MLTLRPLIVAAMLPALVAGCGRRKPVDDDDTDTTSSVQRSDAGAGDWSQRSADPRPGGSSRAGVDENVTLGGVRVYVAGAHIYGNEDLQLIVGVYVDDPGRKVAYRSWRDWVRGSPAAKLADDRGNVYQAKGLDLAVDGGLGGVIEQRFGVKMGYGSGPVYSDRPRVDFLVYEKPVGGCEYLDLDLSAKNVGGSGVFRFRIPKDAWAK